MDGLFGLAGTALGGAIGYLSATLVANQNARLAAGAKLRAAFAPEMAMMRNSPSELMQPPLRQLFDHPHKPSTDELLEKAFQERHAAAIEEFRYLVPRHNQMAYDAAWREYQEAGAHKISDGPVIYRFTIYTSNHELYCQRVEAILRFTKRVPVATRFRHPFGKRRLLHP